MTCISFISRLTLGLFKKYFVSPRLRSLPPLSWSTLYFHSVRLKKHINEMHFAQKFQMSQLLAPTPAEVRTRHLLHQSLLFQEKRPSSSRVHSNESSGTETSAKSVKRVAALSAPGSQSNHVPTRHPSGPPNPNPVSTSRRSSLPAVSCDRISNHVIMKGVLVVRADHVLWSSPEMQLLFLKFVI